MPYNYYKCTVQLCQKGFRSRANNAKYCESCRLLRRRKPKQAKQCPVCRELFMPENGLRMYCYTPGCAEFARRVKQGHYEAKHINGKSWELMQRLGMVK